MEVARPAFPHVPIDRYYIYHFLKRQAGRVSGTVLNVGADGADTIRALFAHCSYVTVDLQGSKQPDIVCDARALPFAAGEGPDCILCSQVLEHADDPGGLLHEFRRVLRPRGLLMLTTPFHPIYHADPDDYWRFTESGLRMLLDGWDDVVVEPYGNRWMQIAFVQGKVLRDVDTRLLDVPDPYVPLGFACTAVRPERVPTRPRRSGCPHARTSVRNSRGSAARRLRR